MNAFDKIQVVVALILGLVIAVIILNSDNV